MNRLLGVLVLLTVTLSMGDEKKNFPRYYLVGNSLTWDTVPSLLDGDTQWHVDCGKSLPFIFENPEKPCVKTSTLWPTALKEKQYDFVSLQCHYGSTIEQDAVAVSQFMERQPRAVIVLHTGWARSAERAAEWERESASGTMQHNVAYFDALIDLLKQNHPGRTIRRTRAMDCLEQVARDVDAGTAPFRDVVELYRDKIHMNTVTGRYMMHNAMRAALGQPRSAKGFTKLDPKMKTYLDSVLERVLEE